MDSRRSSASGSHTAYTNATTFGQNSTMSSSRQSGMPPPQKQQRRQPAGVVSFSLRCNRCRKPMEAAGIVTSCDHVFCDPCCVEHFTRNDGCPVCNKLVEEHEFFDVVVTDPSNVTKREEENKMIEKLLVKPNGNSEGIGFTEICHNLMREQDGLLSNTKVFVKQFMRETHFKLREGEHYKRKCAEYQSQINKMKQQYHSEIQKMQEKATLQASQLKERDSKIQSLTKQLEQASRGRPMMAASRGPGSSQNSGSDGGRASKALPFARRLMHKAQEERDQEQGRPFMSRSRNDSQQNPYSSRAHTSSSNRGSEHRHSSSHGRHGYPPQQYSDF